MYAVVGCSDCSALWVLEGRQETNRCPRCGSRHRRSKLKEFVTTDDEAHAREVRASMLAARQGEDEAFAALDSYDELEERIDDAGVEDDEYLDAAGVDPETVAAAGERATGGSGGGSSRPDVVRAAVEDQDRPDEAAVVEYARERGVPPEAAREILDRLRRRGELVEDAGGYRVL